MAGGLTIFQGSTTKADRKVIPTHQITHTKTGAMFLKGDWLPKRPAVTTRTNRASANALQTPTSHAGTEPGTQTTLTRPQQPRTGKARAAPASRSARRAHEPQPCRKDSGRLSE